MNLSDLQADLYRRLGYASSPATEITTRLTAFLNQAQRDILSEPGMERLLTGTTTFASVASTPQYGLPPSVARIVKIYEATNRRTLGELSQDAYRQIQPDPTTPTGTASHYVDLGFAGVSKQPSDASDIFVDSTAAGDTNTAYIEGYRTGGYFTSLSVTMTGTTAVSLKGANLITDIVEITKFYLSAAAVGEVTLHEDASGGTELARIPIGQTHARYRKVALWITPASAITYSVDYERDIADMANAKDEPLVPVRFHPLLIEGALRREWAKKDDRDRFVIADREYQRMLGNLKYFLYTNADHRPVMGRTVIERPSQLGGWYPSGT